MKLLISAVLTLVSMQAFADITQPLAQNDSLGRVTKAIASQLTDANISTGVTRLWAGQLTDMQSLTNMTAFEALVAKGFAEAFQYDSDTTLPADAKVSIAVGPFIDSRDTTNTVYAMTAALMESNAYDTSNKSLWNEQSRYLWADLRELPVSTQTLVGHATTRIVDDIAGEERTLQYFLLVNGDGKAVQFYTLEGDM